MYISKLYFNETKRYFMLLIKFILDYLLIGGVRNN